MRNAKLFVIALFLSFAGILYASDLKTFAQTADEGKSSACSAVKDKAASSCPMQSKQASEKKTSDSCSNTGSSSCDAHKAQTANASDSSCCAEGEVCCKNGGSCCTSEEKTSKATSELKTVNVSADFCCDEEAGCCKPNGSCCAQKASSY
jgi:hypothetical protein